VRGRQFAVESHLTYVQGYKPPENESLDAEHLQETGKAGMKRHSKPLTMLKSMRIENYLFYESRFWQGFPGENRLKYHR